MFVYTFWEPRDRIPLYLRLCMETWKKFLPNATIVVLDYKNLGEFIDVRELGLNLFSGKFSLPMIADAIRVALLAKHGGVWLDIDTIILNSNAEKYFLPDEKHRTVFFGDTKTSGVHIAFINTPPGAFCLRLWVNHIREKLWNLTQSTEIPWDFMGNSFVNEYAKKHRDELEIIDADIHKPEVQLLDDTLKKNYSADPYFGAYVDYYFKQNHHLAEVDTDLLLLHNSWTPEFYKRLTPDEWISLDCTMTNFLAEILGIKIPPPICVLALNLRRRNNLELCKKISSLNGEDFFSATS